MKKNSTLFMLLLFLVSCGQTNKKKSENTKLKEIPASIVSTSPEGEKILLGEVSIAQIDFFAPWYSREYNLYKKTKTALLKEIKSKLEGVSIALLMGTWCTDSQREIPAMIKILHEAGYKTETIKIVAVNTSKFVPAGLDEGYNLINVPTLIFYKEGKEINRIVEFPLQSLEQDILDILNETGYKNAYAR